MFLKEVANGGWALDELAVVTTMGGCWAAARRRCGDATR
jgi:hypothetical protein